MLPSRYLSSRCQRPLHPLCFVRHHSTSSPRPLKLAIIGAGPSGFYSASRILSSLPTSFPQGRDAVVHMYERLPTPYGLVRYGVAPDHPEVKVHAIHLHPRHIQFTNIGAICRTASTSLTNSPTTPASPSSATSPLAPNPPLRSPPHPPHPHLPPSPHTPTLMLSTSHYPPYGRTTTPSSSPTVLPSRIRSHPFQARPRPPIP